MPVGERPPVAVVLFDLDNFGQLNKLHGHQAGDAVLRMFAGLLKKHFRKGDLVARYGGELGDDKRVAAGLSVADVWLAQARRSGRNQVIGL